MRKIKRVIFLASSLLFHGCFIYGKKEMLSLDSVVKNKVVLSSKLTSVNVSNNQITINGSGFSKVTSVTIKGSGVDQTLSINSKSDTQIVTLATNALALLVGGTFDLIIGTVDAQATYAVTFTLQNGAIEASHLSSMGASSGQILKYNGSSWIPTSQIDAQIYMGTWDATTTIPDVTLSSAGDYYIVSVAAGGYAVGDWIISDGYDWTKVEYSKTSVSSFNGRKGIVTLTAADYLGLKDGTTHKITGSSLNDFADVDLTGAATGNFLKYDGTNWVPASAVGGGSIGSADIATGVIDNSHVSATAAIAQSKIADLATDLSAKQNTSSLAADVKAVTLTGLTSNTGSVAATDTIFEAFRKLMNVSGDYVSASAGASIVTGTIAVSGTGMITVPLASGTTSTEVANITYVGNAIAANGVWTKNGNGVDIGYTAGKVGIGTTAPGVALQVLGQATPMTAGTAAGGFVVSSTNGLYGLYQGVDGGTGAGWLQAARNDAATYYNLILNGRGGNVGIGTTAPSSLLSLGGTAARTIMMERNTTAATAGQGLTLSSGGAIAGTADLAGGDLTLKSGTATGTGSSAIHFYTATAGATATTDRAPTEKMTILGSGNVGIGTTSPSSTLDVAGYINASNTYRIGTTSVIDKSGSKLRLGDIGSNTLTLGFLTYGAERLTIDSSGNVGIGTTAPSLPLHIYSSSGHMGNFDSDYNSAGAAGIFLRNTIAGGAASGSARSLNFGYTDSGGTMYTTARVQSRTESAASSGSIATALDFGTGSNTPTTRMTINSTGNVGVGTTNPQAIFHSVATASAANATAMLLQNNGSTAANTAVSLDFTNTNATTSLAILGRVASIRTNRATSGDSDLAFSVLSGGTTAERLRIMDTGNVGIGTSSPSYKLDVNGTLNVSGATTNVSDIRFKKEIQKIPDALERLLAIDGVTYKFKNEEFPDRDFSQRREMGVIAQTVEKVFPEAVSKDQQGYRSVAYTMLIAPVIEAIKQLSGELKALVTRVFSLEEKDKEKDRAIASKADRDEVDKLKAENKELKKENNLIKSYLCSKDKSATFCK